jgi:hypothetical protein
MLHTAIPLLGVRGGAIGDGSSAIRPNAKQPCRSRGLPCARKGWRGLVAKCRNSRYEPASARALGGSKGQEFVIAGYTVGGASFDAMVF